MLFSQPVSVTKAHTPMFSPDGGNPDISFPLRPTCQRGQHRAAPETWDLLLAMAVVEIIPLPARPPISLTRPEALPHPLSSRGAVIVTSHRRDDGKTWHEAENDRTESTLPRDSGDAHTQGAPLESLSGAVILT